MKTTNNKIIQTTLGDKAFVLVSVTGDWGEYLSQGEVYASLEHLENGTVNIPCVPVNRAPDGPLWTCDGLFEERIGLYIERGDMTINDRGSYELNQPFFHYKAGESFYEVMPGVLIPKDGGVALRTTAKMLSHFKKS